MDLISLITSSSAVFIGAIYTIGFLIIVYNLSRYGLEEYQLLNVKYLHVGSLFIGYSLIALTSGFIISLLLYMLIVDNIALSYSISNTLVAISFIGTFTLLALVAKEQLKDENHRYFYFFIAGSILSSIFPTYALALLTFDNLNTAYIPSIFFIEFSTGDFPVLIVAIWALAFMAQVIYYSRFVYGKPNPLSKIDRTGIGIPNKVQFILDKSYTKLLAQAQIPIKESGITDTLNLIETTSNDYIVMVPFSEKVTTIEGKILKISKNNVFAVIYHPDDFQ